MTLSVRCPKCKKVHRVGDAMAGQRAKCPCGTIMAIPAAKPASAQPPAAATEPASAAASLVVRCSGCGKSHRVKASMAGTAARCPCGAVLQIPGAQATKPAAPGPSAPAPSSIWDELNDDQWAAIESGRKSNQPQAGEEEDDASAAASLYGGISTNGLWRDQKFLVAASGARFPTVCVKTNEPTDHRVRTNFSWCPPWVIVVLFVCNLLVYVIIAAIMTRKLSLEYGLQERLVKKRYIHIGIGVGICVFSILLFMIGGATTGGVDDPGIVGPVLLLLGLVMLPVGLLYALYAGRAVTPVFIDKNKEHVWLKGAHPNFLEFLPVWDGAPRGS